MLVCGKAYVVHRVSAGSIALSTHPELAVVVAVVMDRLEGHVKLLHCSSKQVIIDHLQVQSSDFGHFDESSYMVWTAVCKVDSFRCLRMRLVDICVFECCG
jgi:hypothetical protein